LLPVANPFKRTIVTGFAERGCLCHFHEYRYWCLHY
jgi:hypothetical protein